MLQQQNASGAINWVKIRSVYKQNLSPPPNLLITRIVFKRSSRDLVKLLWISNKRQITWAFVCWSRSIELMWLVPCPTGSIKGWPNAHRKIRLWENVQCSWSSHWMIITLPWPKSSLKKERKKKLTDLSNSVFTAHFAGLCYKKSVASVIEGLKVGSSKQRK